ncbi:hypothetical protein BC833DRAFT_594603 [Globomyces pollinis-pini]|nr:hypothetical protein BC833DRAFT_594603 [Globomyces pollinis-pini]
MTKSSNAIVNTKINTLTKQSILKRNSITEKNRRFKLHNQFQELKSLIPICQSRDDQEKLLILQSSVSYIKNVQKLLCLLKDSHPEMCQQISQFLPNSQFEKPLILTLLPSYKPPTFNFNWSDQQQQNYVECHGMPSPVSPLSLTDSLDKDSKKPNPMHLSNLLC